MINLDDLVPRVASWPPYFWDTTDERERPQAIAWIGQYVTPDVSPITGVTWCATHRSIVASNKKKCSGAPKSEECDKRKIWFEGRPASK